MPALGPLAFGGSPGHFRSRCSPYIVTSAPPPPPRRPRPAAIQPHNVDFWELIEDYDEQVLEHG